MRLVLPTMAPLYRDILDLVPHVMGCPSALAAELWFAGIWGDVVEAVPDGRVLEPMLLDLVTELQRAADARSADPFTAAANLTALRVMAAAAPTEVAGPATEAADRVVERRPRLPVPDWVGLLGAATMDRCERFLGDPFGEAIHLMCRFSYPGGVDPHALWVILDRTCRGAFVQIRMVEGHNVDPLLASIAQDEPPLCSPPQPLDLDVAVRMLRRAINAHHDAEAGLLSSWPELDAEGATVLPLLTRRATATAATAVAPGTAFRRDDPEADDPHLLARRWPPERRAQLVQAFLRSRGSQLATVPMAATLAQRVADLSIGVLGWPPDRIGPQSAALMLADVLPRRLVLPEELVVELEHVAPVWFGWLAESSGAPEWPGGPTAVQRRRLRVTIDAAAEQLGRVYRDRASNPFYPYVADLPRSHADNDLLQDVLDRRWLAVPPPGERGEGDIDLPTPANDLAAGHHHVDDLDAAHPAHRHLIETIRATQSGCDPQSLDARIGIVHQLWADDPPQVWPAARRLRDEGLDRDQTIARLAQLGHHHQPAPAATASPHPDGRTAGPSCEMR